jgi:hypothetical protein
MNSSKILTRAVRAGGLTISLAMAACAGRDPEPIASVQPQDVYSDCTMIRAEIEGNNTR